MVEKNKDLQMEPAGPCTWAITAGADATCRTGPPSFPDSLRSTIAPNMDFVQGLDPSKLVLAETVCTYRVKTRSEPPDGCCRRCRSCSAPSPRRRTISRSSCSEHTRRRMRRQRSLCRLYVRTLTHHCSVLDAFTVHWHAGRVRHL